MEPNFHYQIMAAHTDLQKKALNRLREAGLTAGQPKVLDYLQEHNGVNQKAIAAGCHMEPASVSSVLAGMEHAGLIRRQAEPGIGGACGCISLLWGKKRRNRPGKSLPPWKNRPFGDWMKAGAGSWWRCWCR